MRIFSVGINSAVYLIQDCAQAVGLSYESINTCIIGLFHIRIVNARGNRENLYIHLLLYPARRFKTIHDRHLEIHQDHIGPKVPHAL